MPWVRKVHLVTWGHLPKWLDCDAPKLNIVRHTDYIPEKYLPTFNSNVIELNFNRIEDLAEHFVYFNDDTFPIRPLKPEDFFRNGLPCEAAHLDYITSTGHDLFPHILLNNVDVLNRHFNKKQVMKANKKAWYSPKYGLAPAVRNLLLTPFNNFPGIKWYHLPSPMLKSTFAKLWELEPDILDETSSNRQRSINDINLYLARNWNVVSGNFYPCAVQKSGQLYLLPSQGEEMIKSVRSQSTGLVCANDTENCTHEQFLELKERLNSAFESILPEKSSFEK